MSKESNSGNTGSDAFLELKDIISLNREFDSLCKNLETVQNKVVDEWAWQCAEVVKNSSKDFEKNAASYKGKDMKINEFDMSFGYLHWAILIAELIVNNSFQYAPDLGVVVMPPLNHSSTMFSPRRVGQLSVVHCHINASESPTTEKF